MKTVELITTIPLDRTITIQLPDDVPVGLRRVIILVDQAPISAHQTTVPLQLKMLDWGDTLQHSTWSREDLYTHDGR